jgi:superfamily II DNA or RNA helicase
MTSEVNSFQASIKRRYRNGPDNIGKDLIGPCLSNSVLYRRGTGFFSSGALIAYASSMDHLISERTKIEIICSPVVHDKTLLEVLKNNLTEEQRTKTIGQLANNVVLRALGYQMDTNRRDYKRDLLAYFIAKKIIEVRFAVPLNFENVAIQEVEIATSHLYHVKTGYFKLTDGSIVGFDGSFNESDSGHQYHVDQTQVWRSWNQGDQERLGDVIETVDADWNGQNPYVKIYQMSDEAIALAQRMSRSERPKKEKYYEKILPIPQVPETVNDKDIGLRDYQLAALGKWKDASYKGIFAMATGTGKTKTSIEAISRFKRSIPAGLVVITVPYTSLAYQWMHELGKQQLTAIKVFDSRELWESRVTNLVESHLTNRVGEQSLPIFVCVNKTFNEELFQSILKRLENIPANRLLVVDECHHFNREEAIVKLPTSFNYRIGLSATPYEGEQKQWLANYFGSVIFEFSLRKAIDEGYLCKYVYHPVLIELTKEEADKYIKLSEEIRKNRAISTELEDDEIEEDSKLEGLLETVVAKLSTLKDILIKDGKNPYSLFYCGAGSVEFADGSRVKQIDSLSRMLSELRWNVSKITAGESPGDREKIFKLFKEKELDAITSIRVLDEGIDIPDCRRAFILASQKSQRQGIQRRGRILRKAEGKDLAELFDFIIVGPKLSNQELERLYVRELSRAKMFAEDAINRNECLEKIAVI